MTGGILIVIFGLIFLILLATYFYLVHKDRKEHGPLPWEFDYDNARQERVMREEMQKQNKTKVNINIEDII